MARGTARPRAPRIHPLVPALIAVVVCIVLVAVLASITGGDDSPAAVTATTTSTTALTLPEITTTTTTLPDPVPYEPLLAASPPEDAPLTYRITYDVVENGLSSVQTITVRRPYESLVLSTRDGVQLSGTATSRTDLRTYLSDKSGWLTVQNELHRAAYDLRPAGAIGAMAHLGLVEPAGADEVAGRSCTVYRTGEPTGGSGPTPPSADQTTELCIDDAGLVLREHWEIDGNPVTDRTATSVETGIDVDPAIFDPTPEVDDADELAKAFSTIAVEADAETLDELRTDFDPPAGYTYDGAVFRAGNPSGGGSSSEIVRFYSSGPDLLEVAEEFADRAADLGGPAAVRVDVPGWDEVWFEPGFRNSALRARLTDSSYVELRHHDVGFLFQALGQLRLRDG